MTFQPYLFFGGNCREAFTRYQAVFGGELTLMRMGDAPDMGEVPPEQADVILHASLRIGDKVLMGSDDPIADPFGPVQGMMVAYTADTIDDANRVFDALAEGGSVDQPMTPTFFSPAFGMCHDRFGTPWMVDTAEQPAG